MLGFGGCHVWVSSQRKKGKDDCKVFKSLVFTLTMHAGVV